MPSPAVEQVRAALAKVNDPEIHKPITELGMVDAINISDTGQVDVRVLLTVVGCPMRDRLTNDVTAAVRTVAGVTDVQVELESGRVTVTADAPVGADRVRAAVEEAGYSLAG